MTIWYKLFCALHRQRELFAGLFLVIIAMIIFLNYVSDYLELSNEYRRYGSNGMNHIYMDSKFFNKYFF